MMKLSEIHKVSRLTGEDRRGPLADALAARWGHPAGAFRFRRSSATHVFAAEAGFLRAVPAGWRDRAAVDAVAGLVAALLAGGRPVAPFRPSRDGAPVETVSTAWGDYHAMLAEPAPGERIEVTDLTAGRARAWGAALAEFHDGAAGWSGLPAAFARLGDAPPTFAADPVLASAVSRLAGWVAVQPVDRSVYGVTHGDFELDNMAWVGDAPTYFDFDEAQLSWYVEDVAQATRDLRADPAAFAEFVAGYRTVRPLSDEALAAAPTFAAVRAAQNLVDLDGVIDAGFDDDDPDWLKRLRASLESYRETQRDTVIALPDSSVRSW